MNRKPLWWCLALLVLQAWLSTNTAAQTSQTEHAQPSAVWTSEMAVESALKNSPQIQALMLEVGISQLDLEQADKWPNPGFTLGAARQGEEKKWSQGFHFNWGALFFRDENKKSVSLQVLQSQKRLAAQLMQLTYDTKKAFIEAVAAQETRLLMEKALSVSQAGAELAQRMRVAGNFTKLQEAREQMLHANAVQALAKAKRQEKAALEKLKRLMSWPAGHEEWALPSRLPDLPAAPEFGENLASQALATRFDLQLAQIHTEQLALSAGLIKTSRLINVLDLAVTRQTSNVSATERGLQLGFELPLFDDGQIRSSQAHKRYLQSLQEMAQLVVNAQSEVREAQANYQAAYELAAHYRDVVLPLQQSMAEENMLRYNGMLLGVFDLLADSRMQVSSTVTYQESLKYFWLAQVDLDMSCSGKPSFTPAADAAQ